MNVQGNIEGVKDVQFKGWSTQHALVGWAVDMERPDQPLDVYLRINGNNVSYASASAYRDDLRHVLPGQGKHCFQIPISEDMRTEIEAGNFQVLTPRSPAPLPQAKNTSGEGSFSCGHTIEVCEPLNAIRDSAKQIVQQVLQSDYRSYSPNDHILTGNKYQTVRLGQEVVSGFREEDRFFPFEGYDPFGKVCSDLGSNLGEVARTLVARGADLVRAIEYDEVFVAVSRLVDIVSEVQNIAYMTGDLTRDDLLRPSDIYSCLSVFRFIAGRLHEIAEKTSEMAVFETHAVKGLVDVKPYLREIATAFPFVSLIGYSDWHAGSKENRRALIWAAKSKLLLYRCLFNRANKLRGHSSLRAINLRDSEIPALAAAKKVLALRGASLDEIVNYNVDAFLAATEASLGARSTCFGEEQYWAAFLCGFVQWLKSEQEISRNNIYVKALTSVLASDPKYDPPINADSTLLMSRAHWRFAGVRAMLSAEEANPILFIRNPETDFGDIKVTLEDGECFRTNELDGYHRLAASLMFEVRAPACLVVTKNWH